VLLQTVDHFLIERGQFSDLVLQNLFNVFVPEFTEVVEADETFRIQTRDLLSDEIEERRAKQITRRAGPGRDHPVTYLTLRPGVLRHDSENERNLVGLVDFRLEARSGSAILA
jgi:hypothetical protein